MDGMPRILLMSAKSQPTTTWPDLLDCAIETAETLTASRRARAARRALLPHRIGTHCLRMGVAAVALVALASVGCGAGAAKTRSWQQWPAVNGWAIGKPSARHGHRMAATDNGTVWMLGGRTTDEQISESFLKLDIQTRQWTRMTTTDQEPSPKKRVYYAMAATGRSVWIHGGTDMGTTVSEVNQDRGTTRCRLHKCVQHLCGMMA